MTGSAVLLDTCALIWLANGDPMADMAVDIVAAAEGIYVSPISAWEIGLISRPGSRKQSSLAFHPDPKTWFKRAVDGFALKFAALTPEIAIDASHLPGAPHPDPGDRLLIATARHLNLDLVTRDRKIIAYGDEGFVGVIAC